MSLIFLAAVFVLAGLLLWLGDRFERWLRRDRRGPDEKAREAAMYRSRLLNPRWEEVARKTGGVPGPALRALYADEDLILQESLSVRIAGSGEGGLEEEILASFLPADHEAFQDPWYRYLPAGSFPFARDILGDVLFVELNADGRDAPVKHWYHDGGDIEIIAPSLTAFIKSCREAIRSGEEPDVT